MRFVRVRGGEYLFDDMLPIKLRSSDRYTREEMWILAFHNRSSLLYNQQWELFGIEICARDPALLHYVDSVVKDPFKNQFWVLYLTDESKGVITRNLGNLSEHIFHIEKISG